MSKTIDALKRPDVRSRVRDPFHEEIADTYFKKPPENGRKKAASKMPWVIAALSVLALLAVLISRSNIDIRVNVLNEEAPAIMKPGGAGLDGLNKACVYFLKGAEINNSLVSTTFFSGDAQAYSRLTGSGMLLCNSRGNGWASWTMQFKEPVDMTGLEIEFVARGGTGDERLAAAIVDAENRTYRVEKDWSSRLTKEPKIYKADFQNAGRLIDLARVSAIRFEFGTLTVGNSSTAVIFLDSVFASKSKRMRWL